MFTIEKYDGYISTNDFGVFEILDMDISVLDGYLTGFSGQLEIIIAGHRIGVSSVDVSVRALVTLKKDGPYSIKHSTDEVDGYNISVIGTAGIFGGLSYALEAGTNFIVSLSPATSSPTQWHCIATLIMFNVET